MRCGSLNEFPSQNDEAVADTIWGASSLFIKVAVAGLSPAQVVLGILVLNERIRWNQMIGGVIVVFAVLISQGRFTLRSSPLGRRRAHALRSLPDSKGHHGTLR
jgi:hypothetical protein